MSGRQSGAHPWGRGVSAHLSAPLQPNLNTNHAAKEEDGNCSSGIRSRDNRTERGERDVSVKPRVPEARPDMEAAPNIFHTGGEETLLNREAMKPLQDVTRDGWERPLRAGAEGTHSR